MSNNFFKYWIRPHGLSLKLSRIRSFDQLSSAERLFGFLLRGDGPAASDLLPDHFNVSRMLELTEKSGLALLLSDRLVELDLLKSLPDSARTKLNKLTIDETMTYKVIEKHFLKVLRIFNEGKYTSNMIWIKGVALAHLVYRSPQQRRWGDLDVCVHTSMLSKVVNLLEKNGYEQVSGGGFCNQFGVGPIYSAEDLLLVPDKEMAPCSVLALRHRDLPLIDVKISPFDRGLQMVEVDRFFENAIDFHVRNETAYAPDLIDHLFACLHNFDKDRFSNWRQLMDMHLLVLKISETPGSWEEFLRRCKRESLQQSAWAGLLLCADRLLTPVPEPVFDALLADHRPWAEFTQHTISPYFVWNATSLPILISNALISQDCDRKIRALARSFLPTKQFLSSYYKKGKPLNLVSHTICLWLHWLVLILPGGIVRRTFGPILWPYHDHGSTSFNDASSQVTEDANQEESLPR